MWFSDKRGATCLSAWSGNGVVALSRHAVSPFWALSAKGRRVRQAQFLPRPAMASVTAKLFRSAVTRSSRTATAPVILAKGA